MKIRKDLLTPNPFSRPGYKLLSVSKLIVHYVGNPSTTAAQNVRYFNNLKDQDSLKDNQRYASAHYVLDNKEIIQCVPDDERAYHVGSRTYTDYALSISSYPNARMIGIEYCHPDETGKPETKTYDNLIHLLYKLCIKYNLDPLKDIDRHFDITNKHCPAYYVDNSEAFTKLKLDVREQMK